MSSTGTTTSTSIGLRWPASTIVTSRGPSSVWPPRNRAISSNGRWVADSPIRCGGSCAISSRRSSDSARWAPRLSPGERVDLVDDHPPDAPQQLSRLRGEHQVERFGRRDEDVRGPGLDPTAFGGGGVAGSHRDARLVDVLAEAFGRERDPGERRPEVLLDVHRQRAERRDVQHSAPPVGSRRRIGHEPVERPQERGERLARTRRREDERMAAVGDRRPPLRLRGRRLIERRLEPGADGGGEAVQAHGSTLSRSPDML